MTLFPILAVMCAVNAATPNIQSCKEVQFSVHVETQMEYLLPAQCQHMAQVEITKWLESHPNWRVQRFSCPRVKKEEI